jgi:phytoene dehydrogenase-like protein
MLFCPLMYYGSATERDMEFGQFVIMFKALFLEGFARPFEGVRVVLRVLLDKYRAAGGERRMKCGVQSIVNEAGRATRLVLDDGAEISADHVISSIGAAETEALIHSRIPGTGEREASSATSLADLDTADVARLSFVETINVLNCQPAEIGWGSDTIIFFNDSERFDYSRPSDAVDPRSGVICIPNNFDFGPGRTLPEGVVRVTCLANYDRWSKLPEETYRAEKERWFAEVQRSAKRFLPVPSPLDALERASVTTDMFTPRTIEKFTGHFGGAIYGAAKKNRQGRTALSNVYLCGTDQGFLGIVGAMLSGISMANYHILQKH